MNFEVPGAQGRIWNLVPEQGEHDAKGVEPDLDATRPIEPFITFGIDDGDDGAGMRLTN